jgi:hypothetical protein
MNMLTKIVVIAALAVLYGFAWHNQPAKPGETRQNKKT